MDARKLPSGLETYSMRRRDSMRMRVVAPIVVGVITPVLLVVAVVVAHIIAMYAASTRADKRGKYVELSTSTRSCANFRRLPLDGIDEYDFGPESSTVDGAAAFREFVLSNLQELRPAVFRNVLADNEYLGRIRNDDELRAMLTEKNSTVNAESALHEFKYRENLKPRQPMSAADYITRSKTESLYVVDEELGWLIDGAGVTNTASHFLRGFAGTLHDITSRMLWWSGSGGQDSVTHFDMFENFAIMLRGNKTFYVADHTHYNNAYMPYVADEYGKQKSPIDFTNSEKYIGKYPRYSRMKWMKVVLTPGDMIYVPLGMLHHIEAPPNEMSMMANYFFHGPVWHSSKAIPDIFDTAEDVVAQGCPVVDDAGRTSTFQHNFLSSNTRWMSEGLRSLAFGIFTGAPWKYIVVGTQNCYGCHLDTVCYAMYALKQRTDRIVEEWLRDFSGAIWDREESERPATTWGDAVKTRVIDDDAYTRLVSRVRSMVLHCSAFPIADVAIIACIALSGPAAFLSVYVLMPWKREKLQGKYV